jgi:hypothetical protein
VIWIPQFNLESNAIYILPPFPVVMNLWLHYAMCSVVCATRITDSILDVWIYWHFCFKLS